MTPTEYEKYLRSEIEKAAISYGGNIALSEKLGMNKAYVHRGLGSGKIKYLIRIVEKIKELA